MEARGGPSKGIPERIESDGHIHRVTPVSNLVTLSQDRGREWHKARRSGRRETRSRSPHPVLRPEGAKKSNNRPSSRCSGGAVPYNMNYFCQLSVGPLPDARPVYVVRFCCGSFPLPPPPIPPPPSLPPSIDTEASPSKPNSPKPHSATARCTSSRFPPNHSPP